MVGAFFKEKDMKSKLKWLALISWMCIIFLFSAQTGQESSQSSGLIEQLLHYFSFIPSSIFGIELGIIIRKGAHFTEYMILYGLMFNVMKDQLSFKKSLVFSLIGTFLYACSDEVHQYFVPGRACLLTDVLIDTSGAFLGMVLIFLLNTWCQKSN